MINKNGFDLLLKAMQKEINNGKKYKEEYKDSVGMSSYYHGQQKSAEHLYYLAKELSKK